MAFILEDEGAQIVGKLVNAAAGVQIYGTSAEAAQAKADLGYYHTTGGDQGAPPTGGGGGDTPSNTPLDWRAYLDNWGFPPEVVSELDRIFRSDSDPNRAAHAALAYIRGTDWYRQTFPGINAGISKGLLSDERDYRSYVNSLNQVYQRYYNRDVTTSEVEAALNGGKNAGIVQGEFAGQAYVNANRNDIQYALGAFGGGRLDENQLQQLGRQEVGLDNMLGPELQQRIAKAKARLTRVMQSTLATPSLSVLGSGRLASPSLGAGTTPDVGS